MKDGCVQFQKESLTSSSDASSDDDDDLQHAGYEKSASSELSSSLKSQLPIPVDDSTNNSRSKMVLLGHSYQMDRDRSIQMDNDLNPQQQRQRYNAFTNSDQNGTDLSSHEAQEEISMEELVADNIVTEYYMVMTTTTHL